MCVGVLLLKEKTRQGGFSNKKIQFDLGPADGDGKIFPLGRLKNFFRNFGASRQKKFHHVGQVKFGHHHIEIQKGPNNFFHLRINWAGFVGVNNAVNLAKLIVLGT